MKITNYFLPILALIGCDFIYTSGDLKVCKEIVELIRSQGFPLDTVMEFYIEDLDLKNGLSSMVRNSNYELIVVNSGETIIRGRGRGQIHAHRTASHLTVFIETVDHGHAGEYGYAYSSVPNVISWNNDYWGELWTIGSQINKHWWKIYYDLG